MLVYYLFRGNLIELYVSEFESLEGTGMKIMLVRDFYQTRVSGTYLMRFAKDDIQWWLCILIAEFKS